MPETVYLHPHPVTVEHCHHMRAQYRDSPIYCTVFVVLASFSIVSRNYTYDHLLFHRRNGHIISRDRPLTHSSVKRPRQQRRNHEVLQVVVTSIRLLGRQGLSFRGHDDADGHFQNLVQLRSKDCSSIKVLLNGGRHCYMSHDSQNELAQIMSHDILHSVISRMKESVYFAVIADETTYTSGMLQMCITLR